MTRWLSRRSTRLRLLSDLETHGGLRSTAARRFQIQRPARADAIRQFREILNAPIPAGVATAWAELIQATRDQAQREIDLIRTGWQAVPLRDLTEDGANGQMALLISRLAKAESVGCNPASPSH